MKTHDDGVLNEISFVVSQDDGHVQMIEPVKFRWQIRVVVDHVSYDVVVQLAFPVSSALTRRICRWSFE